MRAMQTFCIKLLPVLLLALPAVVQAQFTYTINNGTITITKYTGSGGAVTIPDTINGLPVTSLGVNAFINCSNMTSLTIGTNVTSIAAYALDTGYLSFTAIMVNPLNPVYSSEDGVLFNKSQTTLIQCPQGKAGSYTIPNSVTNIGSTAFQDCNILTNVAIPNSVTSIGQYAFQSCWNLTSATIPNSVTTIGGYAFFGAGLTSVTIGRGVASIGQMAFFGCEYLTSVYFQGNAPSFGPLVFADFAGGQDPATVYYLPGTTGWPIASLGVPEILWNPQAHAAGVQSNSFGFTITGSTNIPIVVEASANLASASWTPLQSCTLTNGSIYFNDPLWTNYPARFYRIRSP
jgi:hypothetical protein